jgi:dTDP-4-dehydrorhamnose 3,5-epimerase
VQWDILPPMTDSPAPGASELAEKDRPSVNADWTSTKPLIDGVQTHEVRNVVTVNGITTEIFRRDWPIGDAEITHAIHVHFRAGALSGWHSHRLKTDHLFVVSGLIRAVLYDDRPGSPTQGMINEFVLSHARPQLVVIPPLVFHALQALGSEPAAFVNYFDHLYQHDDPDDFRVPIDSSAIPYSFT